jgi:hypothetical protein
MATNAVALLQKDTTKQKVDLSMPESETNSTIGA